MRINNTELVQITAKYPGLEYRENTDYSSFVGEIILNHTYSETCMTGNFNVEIIIPCKFPQEFPKVRELNNRISKNYPHLYTNGQFCLASNLELKKYFYENNNISAFLDDYIIPYLYTYRYYEEYGIYPFGERSHGRMGDLEYLLELFQISNINDLIDIMMYINNSNYRGHNLCPCGSGLKVRNCHGEIIKIFINSTLLEDIQLILKEIEEVKKHNAREHYQTIKKV